MLMAHNTESTDDTAGTPPKSQGQIYPLTLTTAIPSSPLSNFSFYLDSRDFKSSLHKIA